VKMTSGIDDPWKLSLGNGRDPAEKM